MRANRPPNKVPNLPGQPHLPHPEYRADIDGLRALAILSVVAFHLFPRQLQGGFIGVDIFFVISGYLISLIIFGGLEHQRFSYREFYARRIKRIFPALALVLISSLAFAWLNLFPEELRRLSSNIFAGSLFVANLAAMRQNPYFDPAQDYNPMLHLWSLGIEEQFYILWPVLLVVAWKRGWNFLKLTLALAIASLLINLYLTPSHASIAFYSPFSRFWELMLGGILAYLSLHNKRLLAHYQNSQATIGLILIGTGLLLLNEERAFPGWWALLPTIGAALMISAGSEAWLNRHLLANPILVWIGLISYPLYLWHWPLLSFTKYAASGSNLGNTHLGLILLASVILASLTYWLIEQPCRKQKSNRILVPALLILMIFIAVIALLTFLQTNNSRGFTRSIIVKNHCQLLGDETKHRAVFCQSDSRQPNNLVVWGDSHAAALYPGLVKSSKTGHNWALMGRISCAPVTGGEDASNTDCGRLNEDILNTLTGNKAIKTVLLVAAQRVVNANPSAFSAGISNSVDRLMAAKKRVILLIGGPNIIQTDRYFNSVCLDRPISLTLEPKVKYCSISRTQHDSYAAESRRIASGLQAKWPSLIVIDPASLLCNDQSCDVLKQGQLLYSYTDHLSDYGSLLISELIYQQSPELLQ